MNVNIDLREEMNSFMKDFSMPVLIVRNNNLTRCSCYDPLHRSGKRNCKICGGTGKISLIHKIDVICQTNGRSDYGKMSELGLSVSNTIVMYFRYNDIPKNGDQIFIVGFDNKNIPIDIKKSCSIISVEEIRGDHGRVEYYKTYAKYSPENIINDQKRLNAIPLAYKKKIMEGGKLSWSKK